MPRDLDRLAGKDQFRSLEPNLVLGRCGSRPQGRRLASPCGAAAAMQYQQLVARSWAHAAHVESSRELREESARPAVICFVVFVLPFINRTQVISI
jgi:hypothetical protein